MQRRWKYKYILYSQSGIHTGSDFAMRCGAVHVAVFVQSRFVVLKRFANHDLQGVKKDASNVKSDYVL